MKKLLCLAALLCCVFLVSCRRQPQEPVTTEPTTEYVIDEQALLEAE